MTEDLVNGEAIVLFKKFDERRNDMTEDLFNGEAIVLFKKFDERRNDMTEDFVNVEAIGKFVAANALPFYLKKFATKNPFENMREIVQMQLVSSRIFFCE